MPGPSPQTCDPQTGVGSTVGGGGTERLLVQMPGGVNGIAGRFVCIADGGDLTDQRFVRGGTNGMTKSFFKPTSPGYWSLQPGVCCIDRRHLGLAHRVPDGVSHP